VLFVDFLSYVTLMGQRTLTTLRMAKGKRRTAASVREVYLIVFYTNGFLLIPVNIKLIGSTPSVRGSMWNTFTDLETDQPDQHVQCKQVQCGAMTS